MSGIPRSQVLLAYTASASGNSAAWITPADHVTLVKSGYFTTSDAAAGRLVVLVGAPGAGVSMAVLDISLPPGPVYVWLPWFALNPGYSLYVSHATANLSCWISGAVLAGAPQFPIATRRLPDVEALPAAQDPRAQPGRPAF